MDYSTGINPKTLEKCTLSQACEYIAWDWKPVDKFADIALNHAKQRTNAKEKQNRIWFDTINMAADKIIYWLHCKDLTVSGTNKSIKQQILNLSENFSIDIENNTITDGQNTYTDVEIDFFTLQCLIGRTTPTIIYTLSLIDDTVYLLIEGIAYIKIKKFTPNSKNGRVIKYVMEHPNTLIKRTELEKLSINNFDAYDRIDQMFTNTFPKAIINLFFICTTDSAKFIPSITDIDIKKHGLKLLTIE